MSPLRTYAPQNWNDPEFRSRDAVWRSFALRCFGLITPVHYNRIPTRMQMVDHNLTAAHALLIDKGLDLANQLHVYLSYREDGKVIPNPTLKWNHKFVFLALLGYAASMAKFSQLDKDDYMALAEGFYDNVDIAPRDAA